MRHCKLVSAVAALCLAVGCQREKPVTTSQQATNNNQAGVQSVTTTSADDETRVQVTFSGPILQITTGQRRAIIPVDRRNQHPHDAYLEVPARNVDVAKFEAAFPNACDDSGSNAKCRAPLHRVGLRVIGIAGPSLKAFNKSHPTFAGHIEHMKEGKNSDFLDSLHDDVTKDAEDLIDDDDPDKDSPVRAYFELDGGEFTATEFICESRFKGEDQSQCRTFGRDSILNLIYKGGASLQVRNRASSNWTKFEIPLHTSLSGKKIEILIENKSRHPSKSHHDIFGELAQGKYKDLPDVVPCPCRLKGTVPGCGNDQWP